MPNIRCGYAKIIKNSAQYSFGTLVSASVQPSYVQLSRLAGGISQVSGGTVALVVSSLNPTAEAIIYPNNKQVGEAVKFAYITEKVTNGDFSFEVTVLDRVCFAPLPKSVVAKGNGSTTITTFSMTGIAFPDYDDNWEDVEEFTTLDLAMAYIDALS